jgi:hypothetical protein
MGTCVVTLKTGQQIKLRAEELKPIMEEARRERSKNIQITDRGHFYRAYNPDTKQNYYLNLEEDQIECTCADYHNQLNFFKKPEVLCQHGYALLHYLGINSLTTKEYRKVVEESYLTAEYENYCAQQEMMSYAWQDDSRYWG